MKTTKSPKTKREGRKKERKKDREIEKSKEKIDRFLYLFLDLSPIRKIYLSLISYKVNWDN